MLGLYRFQSTDDRVPPLHPHRMLVRNNNRYEKFSRQLSIEQVQRVSQAEIVSDCCNGGLLRAAHVTARLQFLIAVE